MSRRPICATCRLPMFCLKTGRVITVPDSTGEPYQLFHGDEYQCRNCRTRVVSGMGGALDARADADAYEREVAHARATGNLLEVLPTTGGVA